MNDIKKEEMVRYLMEKDELVIKTAIIYADAYLQYGVDVTEIWDTATKQSYSLIRAEKKGYYKGIEELLPKVKELEEKVKKYELEKSWDESPDRMNGCGW